MLLQLIINTLIVGSAYGLVALAFRLMYSVSPFFNLTLGAVAALGAYMSYWLLPIIGLSALPVAVLMAAAFACLLEFIAYKPLRERGASSMILLVVSLGIYTIFESVIHLAFGPQYHILGKVLDMKLINLGFAEIPIIQLMTIVIFFAFFFFLNYFLHDTNIGKQIRAIHDSATLADIIGIRKDRIILIVSVIVGLILGIAGILIGYDTGLEPTMGFNILFKGMIAAIIGGMGRMRGAFFGALFLAFSENVAVWLFSSEWRDLIAFVIFISFLYIRPDGIFQTRQQKAKSA